MRITTTTNFHTLLYLLTLLEGISVGAAPTPGQVQSYVQNADNLARPHHLTRLVGFDTNTLPLQRRKDKGAFDEADHEEIIHRVTSANSRLRRLHGLSKGADKAKFDRHQDSAVRTYLDTEDDVRAYTKGLSPEVKKGLSKFVKLEWPGGHLGGVPRL